MIGNNRLGLDDTASHIMYEYSDCLFSPKAPDLRIYLMTYLPRVRINSHRYTALLSRLHCTARGAHREGIGSGGVCLNELDGRDDGVVGHGGEERGERPAGDAHPAEGLDHGLSRPVLGEDVVAAQHPLALHVDVEDALAGPARHAARRPVVGLQEVEPDGVGARLGRDAVAEGGPGRG